MGTDQSLFLTITLGMEKGTSFLTIGFANVFIALLTTKAIGMNNQRSNPKVFPGDILGAKPALNCG